MIRFAVPERPDRREQRQPFSPAAGLVFVTACGIAAVSASDALSRSGRSHAELLFWIGLMLIFLPTTAFLLTTAPRRGERVALLLVMAVALYLVKVIRDPFGFTYADELVHEYNVRSILHSHALFGHNPILPVTPKYPGLESVTAAVAAATGLSPFAAGLVIIGIARVLMVLGLFLVFQEICLSARVASVATALYAATPNFLFFSAQFSYESLALPLAVFAVYAALRWWYARARPAVLWFGCSLLMIAVVAMTHHLTSYGLVAILAAMSAVAIIRRRGPLRRMTVLTVAAAGIVVSWLVVVGSSTVGYLTPVLSRALSASLGTVTHEQAPRSLFTSVSGHVAPLWERVTGLASAALVLVAQPVGLRYLWRHFRYDPPALVLGAASLAYLGTYALRLVPAAWETGARMSEFLFIGAALIVAMAIVAVTDWSAPRSPSHIIVWLAAGCLFIGGVVAGSASGFRTAQPIRVRVDGGYVISPQGTTAAEWLGSELPSAHPVAAEQADARLLMVYGNQNVVAGTNPDIDSVLQTPVLYRWQVQLLERLHVRYIVVDARRVSDNVSTGYFFSSGTAVSDARFPAATLLKFERAGATRIFDSGTVVIDDLATLDSDAASP